MDLFNISPIDGRYNEKLKFLNKYFSEASLIKYRVLVSLRYFKFISNELLIKEEYNKINFEKLEYILVNLFSDNYRAIPILKDIKNLEYKYDHDVMCIIEYLKSKYLLFNCGDSKYAEYFHLGLTSQDITTSALMIPLKKCRFEILIPILESISIKLKNLSIKYENDMMLGFTHGQSATPTTFGNQLKIFYERLKCNIKRLEEIPITTKFGGSTGGLNSLRLIYHDKFSKEYANSNMSNDDIMNLIDNKLESNIINFVENELKLELNRWTTQIEPYDNLSILCNQIRVINNILLDLCGDMWLYISKKYIKEKIINDNSVGSSAMPHKINPIKWENSEGNLKIGNALLVELSNKLPISRLQRDLSDSTILRNLGSIIGYCLIGWYNINDSLDLIIPDIELMKSDIFNNLCIVSEGLQVLLRYYGVENAYYELKKLTRGSNINVIDLINFIDALELCDDKKKKLKKLVLDPVNNFKPINRNDD